MPKTTKKTNKYATDSEFVRDLEHDITAFIKAGAEQSDVDEKYNELALRLFEYQYNMNIPYQKYCDKYGKKPGTIDSWEEIPVVTTSAFKEVTFRTFPEEETVMLMTSSGTDDPEKRSKVYLNKMGLELFDLSTQTAIELGLYGSPDEKFHALLLGPDPELTPEASIVVRGLIQVVEGHYIGKPEFFIKPDGFDFAGLAERLRQAEETGEPVVIAGATFGHIHFFDYCQSQGISFKLPEGSRCFDGGGYKGKARQITREEYCQLAKKVLDVPSHLLVNCYGMVEVPLPFMENVFYNHRKGIKEPRYKMIPHWGKTLVVDPDTLKPLPKGERGLLRHYCLANLVTAQAIQTDDVGVAIGSGFEILGRAKGSEARGCSIAIDELLSAQKK
ncbi:hypothetical protein CEE36_03210 [candidate division TA06 bacterium B3_TA06]|uniref:Acyl-protein synthetase LuxE domain-containing protein n=1 Tax=candidate division TA06 bacterium B3_TA06 TaxID=2012487 RepID=A0A532V933_UNCT6|nr:MAG: hypothetical protein CEE36_03210 [candidate division TA06 bacterium B3_TA06]